MLTSMRLGRSAAILLALGIASEAAEMKDYPIKPVPFTAVHVNDQFWAPRIEVNRTVSIPTAFDQCDRTGRIENFVRAAQAIYGANLTDKHMPGNPFDDTDPYKVIEGASYSLSVNPDGKLHAYINDLISKIAAAQEPDGYLYTTRSIDPDHPHPWAGKERWINEEVLSHELYNAGHLYEAAVANYQATGDRQLLEVALKNADLLVATFGPGKRSIYSGHQVVEMGLVKLYRVTGKQQYLDLAKFFLDSRGPGGRAYNQADQLPINQDEAEGHAVRATYMYSGMADVAALTNDRAYLEAIDRIWNNMVEKKFYITGGIGALGEGEAFGANYELPNMTAYNETCAAVGSVFWDQRLFLLHGDAKYVDVLERTLYNGLISGVSLDGQTYFYPNPLESNGQHERSPWFGTACCPGNITRFTPSVPGYVYAQTGSTVYINLFMSNQADITLDNGQNLRLKQQTRYPWDGTIHIEVDPAQTGTFTLKIRVPGWAQGQAIPGNLYRFADANGAGKPVKLTVNGKAQALGLDHGYATVTRTWSSGNKVQLDLPMPIHRVEADEKVVADRNKVALERGPLVYCAEWKDSPDKHVRNIVLENGSKLSSTFNPSLLNGVETIHGNVLAFSKTENGQTKQAHEAFTAVPYYAWANRSPGQMEVWIADTPSSTHPTPYPTLASQSKVTASGSRVAGNGNRDPHLVADGEEPTSSSDLNSFYSWPAKGDGEHWVQYDFEQPARVSSASVYWFARHEDGSELPAGWQLLYRDGSEWKPVAAQDNYGVALDRYNQIHFQPVLTSSLRLVMHSQAGHSVGIEEWQVH